MSRAKKPQRVLFARAATVKVKGKPVDVFRGQPIPSGVSADDVEKLDAQGALVPLEPDPVDDVTGDGSPAVNPPFDLAEADAAAIAAHIREHELTAAQTVELAGGDKALAEKILEAEDAATDGSPRDDVVTGLAAIVDGKQD